MQKDEVKVIVPLKSPSGREWIACDREYLRADFDLWYQAVCSRLKGKAKVVGETPERVVFERIS